MGFFDKAVEIKEKTRLMTLKLSHSYGSVGLHYIGGGEIQRECNIRLMISNRYLKYGVYVQRKIPIEDLKQVSFQNDQQLTQRLTATRVLLTGGLGIFFPKKKLNNMKYLTIEYSYNGMDMYMILSGREATRAYSLINKAIMEHRELIELSEKYGESPIITGDEDDNLETIDDYYEDDCKYEEPENNELEDATNSPYDKLKELKNLLDIGVITQEEFETKKEEILERI